MTMKLAFSTLGCPEWTFEQILDAAQRYGYDGLEFRGLLQEIDLVNVPEFAPTQIATTRRRLEEAGLGVAGLGSSATVVAATASEIDMHTATAHVERYIDLAKEIGAGYVRVFCGNVPASLTRDVAVERAAGLLRRVGAYAETRGVTVVVETHDAFIRSESVMELIRLANHPAVQVLWDIHHPYRMAGETVEHTIHYLNGHIRATHVKDSVLNESGSGYRYVLLGHGDVPVLEAIRALKAIGYDGYLTVEWEKRWIPDLPAPDVAFPQYLEQMRAWLAQ